MALKKLRFKHLKLDDELISWYEESYPEGSLNWVFNMLLREFKNAHRLEGNEVVPQSFAERAGLELFEKIKEKSV